MNAEIQAMHYMKKQTVMLLVVLTAMSNFLLSCGNNMNKHTGAFEFDSIQVNETVHLFGDTAKPACNLIVNFTYISQSSDSLLKDSLNAYFLAASLGDSYSSLKPQEAVRKYTDNYIREYREDLEPAFLQDQKDTRKEDGTDIDAWYSYYKYISSHIQFYEGDLLIYRCRYEEYTGGAQGIYKTNYLNLNLKTMTPIRLEDLFVSNYKEALTDLLWNQLMADNRVATHQELEDMGYCSTGDLGPTENFCLGKEGITFHYNVYEITPYIMGAVDITIPYDMMQHLLNEDTDIIKKIRG